MFKSSWLVFLLPWLKPYRKLMCNNKERVENSVNQRILQKKLINLDDFLWINWLEWDKSILLNLCSGMKKHLEAVIEKAGLTIDC